MAICVNHTDFVFPYVVPNKERILPAFSAWLDRQEEKALIELLGFHWFNEFKDLDEPRWSDLKDGKIYSAGGKTYRYEGLKSVMLPLLYAKYIRVSVENTFTGSSVVRTDVENAVVISTSNVISTMINEAAKASEALEHYVVNDGRYEDMRVNTIKRTNQFGV